VTGPNNYTRTAAADVCAGLRRQLAAERKLRVAAERNAMRFHALLIRARVDLIKASRPQGEDMTPTQERGQSPE
jgi:hypothetical protein